MQTKLKVLEEVKIKNGINISNGVPIYQDKPEFISNFNIWSFSENQLNYIKTEFTSDFKVFDYLAEEAIIILKCFQVDRSKSLN